jgi:2-dehydro-3-deoxyphosphooctonate aldolase (KDO 8-P synthase)
MQQRTIQIANLQISNNLPFVLMSGLNVLEDIEVVREVAHSLKQTCVELDIPLIFKASFDKANRSSVNSFRGPGLQKGLQVLEQIKQDYNLPIITDVHEPQQATAVAEVADILQLPAFLSRQTDLVVALAKTGKAIQVKKAQFLAAHEMQHIIKKCTDSGNDNIVLCERGSCFGYNNLVVDMLNFGIMKGFGYPVTFDVTHSLQLPGGLKDAADGRGGAVTDLALAGMSQKIAGLFLETHPDPSRAKCDGPCAIELNRVKPFLTRIKALDKLVKNY